ncbi:MAG: thioredoxin reductase [Thermoproteota archaeon]|nr:thioredoxin reductase [Thermoproteota archaeon]
METLKAEFDIIILGAGPAGLTAGIYALRRGLRILVLESKFPGGRAVEGPQIENYPGFPEPITGEELAKKILSQFEQVGGKVNVNEEALALLLDDEIKTVITRSKKYTTRSVIIAIGVQRRRLFIPGEKEFSGKGVTYCALCDGPLFQGQDVAVVGSEDEAFEDALFLSDIASKVYVISKEIDPPAANLLIRKLEEKRNTEILRGYSAEAIIGDIFVNSLRVKRLADGDSRELKVKAVFIAIGVVPNTEIMKRAGIELADGGSIKIDRRQRTNVEGVFAAGDCTGGGMQIATAVGEGAMAAISAFRVLQ